MNDHCEIEDAACKIIAQINRIPADGKKKPSLVAERVNLNTKDGLGIRETDHISVQCSKNAEFLIIETPINQK